MSKKWICFNLDLHFQKTKLLFYINLQVLFLAHFAKVMKICVKKKDITEGPSVVFTRKAVVDKTIIRNSSNVGKSLVKMIQVSFILFKGVKICTKDGV